MFDIEMSKINKENEAYFKQGEENDTILTDVNNYFTISREHGINGKVDIDFINGYDLKPSIKEKIQSEFLKFFKNEQGW
jgi:hypothetical protein